MNPVCLRTARPHPLHRGLLRALGLSLLLGLLAGCGPAADPAARPAVLRISWTPSEDEPERIDRWRDLAAYLTERLGMPIELVQTANYSTQIEAFRAHKIEVGSMGPLSYVIARQKTSIEPLFVRGSTEGSPDAYHTLLMVPADSPLHSLDDVRARAGQLTLGFVDPASTSGHLVPRAHLETLNLVPEKDFARVVFTMSHLATAMGVKAGHLDLAAVSSSSWERFVRDGRVAESDVRVLWRSPGLVPDVTAIRGDLPADLKTAILAAFLSFRTERPASWAAFAAGFPDSTNIWVPITDAEFDPIRELARRVEHLALLEQ